MQCTTNSKANPECELEVKLKPQVGYGESLLNSLQFRNLRQCDSGYCWLAAPADNSHFLPNLCGELGGCEFLPHGTDFERVRHRPGECCCHWKAHCPCSPAHEGLWRARLPSCGPSWGAAWKMTIAAAAWMMAIAAAACAVSDLCPPKSSSQVCFSMENDWKPLCSHR